MTNTFTLDNLRAEVEKQYAPVVIGLSDSTEVTLNNLLRLPRKTREAVLKLLHDVEDAGSNVDDDESTENIELLVDAASQILLLVSDRFGPQLVKELDGDLTLTMKVLERWMEATRVGEAPRSDA